jgi:hypothetical protein
MTSMALRSSPAQRWQRRRADRQAPGPDQSCGQRRRRLRHCHCRALRLHGREAREHHPGRHQGRRLQGPQRRNESLQGALRQRDLDAHAGGRGQGRRRAARTFQEGRIHAGDDRLLAPNPVVFAMANPDPEITYEEARAVREDIIMATGRSDYPNQVNNVLGFPFIFRGALDVHATTINEEMKLAATYALAALAKEDVPDSVPRLWCGTCLKFGRDYIIPKPFDPRVLVWEAAAVAKAAMETGVAQNPVNSMSIASSWRSGWASTRTDARHDSQGAGESQACGFPRGQSPEDSARLPRTDRRKNCHSRAAGPHQGGNPAPRRIWEYRCRHQHCRTGDRASPSGVCQRAVSGCGSGVESLWARPTS